jgi:hypothetical protein
MIEVIFIAGLAFGLLQDKPKTYTSKELYEQKLVEGNYMNVQKIDYFFTDEPQK